MSASQASPSLSHRAALLAETAARCASWVAGGYGIGWLASQAAIGHEAGGAVGLIVALGTLAVPLSGGWKAFWEQQRARGEPSVAPAAPQAQGPGLRERLARWLGEKLADRVLAHAIRAKAEAHATGGRVPDTLLYSVDPRAGTMRPATQPEIELARVSSRLAVLRVNETGETLTLSVKGKLSAVGGMPSMLKVDPEGEVQAAAWHTDGRLWQSWTPSSPDSLERAYAAAAVSIPQPAEGPGPVEPAAARM